MIAQQWGLSRTALDEFALAPHAKAGQASATIVELVS